VYRLTQQALDLAEGEQEIIDYLQSIIKTIPRQDNPDQISQFNYQYNDAGELVNIDTG
jgi:hypothetical protein